MAIKVTGPDGAHRDYTPGAQNWADGRPADQPLSCPDCGSSDDIITIEYADHRVYDDCRMCGYKSESRFAPLRNGGAG